MLIKNIKFVLYMSLNNLISNIEIKLNNLLTSYKEVKSINTNLNQNNADLISYGFSIITRSLNSLISLQVVSRVTRWS